MALLETWSCTTFGPRGFGFTTRVQQYLDVYKHALHLVSRKCIFSPWIEPSNEYISKTLCMFLCLYASCYVQSHCYQASSHMHEQYPRFALIVPTPLPSFLNLKNWDHIKRHKYSEMHIHATPSLWSYHTKLVCMALFWIAKMHASCSFRAQLWRIFTKWIFWK